MSNLVLFRLKGDDTVYLVDLEAETVERHEYDEVEGLVDKARESGVGFEFVLAAKSRTGASQFYMHPHRGPAA